MKPVSFPEVNMTYAKDQPEYKPLPGCKFDTPEGHFVFCMKLSLKERVKILISGKMWACLLTFNKPLTPTFFSTNKQDVITTK